VVVDQVGAVLDPGSFALRCADTYFLGFLLDQIASSSWSSQ
jgi:hypothetical protein